MATSGTYSWSIRRDEIIGAALRKLSVLSGGSLPQSFEVTAAAQALNAMIKGFQVDGMPVWRMIKYTFNTQVNVSKYTIGEGMVLNTPEPLKIVQAYRNETNSTNVPLNIYTQFNYNMLPQGYTSGPPVNLYYQPLRAYGEINLWPTPLVTTTTISILYQAQYADMNSALDDIDFPSYWSEAVIYGLAWRLAPEYGIPLQDRGVLAKEAEYFHQQALSYGSEEGSLYLQPDWSGKR